MLGFLVERKIEVRFVFINFHSMIQTQFQTKIQILRIDNGTKYFNNILGNYLQEHGIIHQSSCVDTSQQNGVTERKNRHILKVARALMFTSNMPKIFWGNAILTATYLINRSLVRFFLLPLLSKNSRNIFPHLVSTQVSL